MKEGNKKQTTSRIARTVLATTMLVPTIMSVPVAVALAYDAEHASKVQPRSEIKSNTEAALEKKISNSSSFVDKYAAQPKASLGTGFTNKFKDLSENEGILHINTASNTLLMGGFSAQIKTVLKMDPEIASEFFATPNYEQYMNGTVHRKKESGFGQETVDIKDLWNKQDDASTFWKNKDNAYYDAEKNEIVIISNECTTIIGDNMQDVDLTFDFKAWAEDNNKIVERRNSYDFSVRTASIDFLGVNATWGTAESVLFSQEVTPNTWVEDEVTKPTLYSEDEKTFKGNAKQTGIRQHDTTYTVSLNANGSIISDIPIDENGDWEFTLPRTLADGAIVTAFVNGEETTPNGNGQMDVKKSENTYYTVGEDSTPWENWTINAPDLSDAYDAETIISGSLPSQNHQENRTYELITQINGTEVKRQQINGETGDLLVPLFDDQALVKGDVITSYILAHQDGMPDKESQVSSTTVKENKEGQEDWKNWTVEAPSLETVQSGATEIKGRIPTQNKFNGRSYDVQVLVNDQLVATEKNYTYRGGEFTTSVGDVVLKAGDKVSAIVVGHEANEADKDSEVTTTIVEDDTNHEAWVVNPASINEVKDTDTSITGHLSEQDTEHKREYDVEVSLNGEKVTSATVNSSEDYTIELPQETELSVDDDVSVKVVGYQPNMPNKESESTSTKVVASSDYEDWEMVQPSINELDTDSTSISGNVSEQNTNFNRSYKAVVTVNGEEIVSEAVESGADYNFELPENKTLAENDKVAVTIVGSEADKEDKTSEDASTIVKDASNWEDWKVEAATIEDLTTESTNVTGHVAAQDTNFDRSYKAVVTVNGEEIISEAVESDTDYNFELPKGKTLAEDDKVVVTIVGSQADKEDKTSEETSTIVKDGSNWEDWKVEAATIEDLTTESTNITGHVAAQDTNFDRSYKAVVTVNGEEIISEAVESDTDYNFELPKGKTLAEDDKVVVTIVGSQADKEDKTSEGTSTIVKDASNWEDWKVEAATVNSMTTNSKTVTGTIPAQNADFKRTYSAVIKVNGEVISDEAVTTNSDYNVAIPESIDLNVGDKVETIIIGHQDGKEDKMAEAGSTIVEAVPVAPTTSEFRNGYWQNFGLVYEGTVSNDDWDMTESSKIQKSVDLVDQQGNVVKTIKVTNTNWYNEGKYDGYQFIVNNDMLGSMDAGQYSFVMTVTVDGVVQEPVTLKLDAKASRRGDYHNNYAELENVVVKENQVFPIVANNEAAIKIEKYADDAELKLFNKYWNGTGDLIFEGYFKGQNQRVIAGLNKTLIIKDASGNSVYTKGTLSSAPTSWGTPNGVADENTFQAKVPKAYTDQSKFTYVITLTNDAGTEVNVLDMK